MLNENLNSVFTENLRVFLGEKFHTMKLYLLEPIFSEYRKSSRQKGIFSFNSIVETSRNVLVCKRFRDVSRMR